MLNIENIEFLQLKLDPLANLALDYLEAPKPDYIF